MKKQIFTLLLFMVSWVSAQKLDNIQTGEVLNYRIHYGFLNAGTATLSTTKINFQGQPHFYVKGVGRSIGAVRAFFKVDDLYESYINYNTGLPTFYVRNVREGSYTQHYETVFNHNNHTLTLFNKEEPKSDPKILKTVNGIQDMLSAFYYLRSFDQNQLKIGDTLRVDVWIDDEMFPFKLRIAGTEDVKTKFGKVNCLKIIPSVISGRVFKEKEGVTLWVTNDGNHIPVSIKAQLAVGSLKADLDGYSNVKYPIAFK